MVTQCRHWLCDRTVSCKRRPQCCPVCKNIGSSREVPRRASKNTRILAKDATDPVLGQQAVELANQEFGQLDGLIVNHGMFAPVERVASSNVEEWKRHFDVNLFSAISIVRVPYWHCQSQNG